MKIILNGELLSIENTKAISNLLEEKNYNGKLIAVAVNGEFLPKAAYANTTIKENDKIEIVAPMQGG